MQQKELWRPTKFVQTRSGLRASRDPEQVVRGSRFVADAQARMYEKAIRDHASGRLLDLGCGFVPLYGIYKDLVRENICVDWERTLHPSPHLDYTCDLNSSLPLPDGEFDTVLLTDVLEHIHDPACLWKEMARVLKQGGKLILGVPFLYPIHEAPHDYFRYTEHALRLFCARSGLTLISLEAFGGLAAGLVEFWGRITARSGLLSGLVAGAGSILLSSAVGKISAARTSRTFPIAYCLVAQKR
ncbi:class I SAM-dependent methyltransferase [bacterium]|nr:MAG: class I SAM-dependent methyltransferase [bacterium]